MNSLYILLNYALLSVALTALLYGLSRPRRQPSPIPLQPSPEEVGEEGDIAAIRPAAYPHQVVWSGFMARALIALNLVITLVVFFNPASLGTTALLFGAYAFSLRLMWPLIADARREG
jgi:hypothetical protein